jgi:hypothetical protein
MLLTPAPVFAGFLDQLEVGIFAGLAGDIAANRQHLDFPGITRLLGDANVGAGTMRQQLGAQLLVGHPVRMLEID